MATTKLGVGERVAIRAAGAVALPATLFLAGLSGIGFFIAWPFVGMAGQALADAVKGESDDDDWIGETATSRIRLRNSSPALPQPFREA